MKMLEALKDRQFLLNVVLCPAIFCLIAISITAFKPAGPELFQYDQQAVQQGEWWRFLTSHFTHSTWNHLMLNLAGLIIMAQLFSQVVTWKLWLAIMFFGSLFCSFCFYLFAPESYIYVGMSDVLHGVIIAFAMLDFRHFKLGSTILVGGTLAKVIWEQSPWYVETSGEFIGGAVAIDSHMYGSVFGILIGLVFLGWRHVKETKTAS